MTTEDGKTSWSARNQPNGLQPQTATVIKALVNEHVRLLASEKPISDGVVSQAENYVNTVVPGILNHADPLKYCIAQRDVVLEAGNAPTKEAQQAKLLVKSGLNLLESGLKAILSPELPDH